MVRPLVSAVIPSFNYGRFVCEAVRSVQEQTYAPVEILVVDDGSTDDTRHRLATFGDSIRYLYQENRGLAAARNTGIRNATGEWVAFLDADDVWHRQKLQIQLAAITELTDVSFLGSPGSEDASLVEELASNPEVRRLTVRDFLISTPLTGSSALVRRSCFDRVGLFDEDLRSVEDRDMWLRLAAVFASATVTSPCVWYRNHSAQMSRNPARMYDSFVYVLRRFFEQHPEYANLRNLANAFLHRDASFAHLLAGNRWASLAHLTRSILYCPRHLSPRNHKYMRAKMLARLTLGDGVLRRLRMGK